MRIGVLTVSDRAHRGEYADQTGPAVAELIKAGLGAEMIRFDLVPDERDVIVDRLGSWAEELDLIVTNGGTGLAPRDVTPEATLDVIDRQVPGLAERMRAAGSTSTPLAALSRQVVGTRGTCLIVNLPGSVKGAVESLEAIIDLLTHAIDTLSGADHS